MKIVWDEPKRLANIHKHGFDFGDVDDFEWEDALIGPSHSGRLKAIGFFRGHLTVVIYSQLGTGAISIVGMRRAGRSERRNYEER